MQLKHSFFITFNAVYNQLTKVVVQFEAIIREKEKYLLLHLAIKTYLFYPRKTKKNRNRFEVFVNCSNEF